MWILLTLLAYFAVLFCISRWTGRRATNDSFYRGERRSPWWLVAFGMVGASVSGVTFVSVPGMVMASQMTYLQLCMGFLVGYVVVACVLLPVYYRLNLTSIYTYLGQRLGPRSYQSGAWFFLLSKMTGAAVKFYVVCMILQQFVFDAMGVPFWLTVVGLVALIWLYTHHGGIRTLVFTDTFQTVCLFSALLLIIYSVIGHLGMTVGEAAKAVADSEMSRVFVFDDWASRQNFWKQFLSGIFIVLVMTGLDQDMMQKNLTCRTLKDAQKDMCTYGVAFLPANLLFLALGVLLTMLPQLGGAAGDALLPAYVQHVAANASAATLSARLVPLLFVVGIVAASFSSADSALTSLTTCYCVDISGRAGDERLRRRTHVVMCVLFMVFILLFRYVNSTSLVDAVYILVSYTYGPLLGLFAYGLLTRRPVGDRWVPAVCVASPLLCLALDTTAKNCWNYQFGYELLMLNGLFTFAGLWLSSRGNPSAECHTPS
ncbi:MAG: sodium:solute symporter [Prevotella sp.]|nr:sodium:solute symporter [Prevotella sp.]